MPGFKPCAQPRIVDIRRALPKIGRQSTLNPQMIQLQLDDLNAFRKIATDIVYADVQSDHSQALVPRFDDHRYLLFSVG
jgi:hypothetical protein